MTITLIWTTFTVVSILSGKQSNLVGLSHFCKTVMILVMTATGVTTGSKYTGQFPALTHLIQF